MNISKTELSSTKDEAPRQKVVWYKRAKRVLLLLSQAVLLAPLKLPAKVKAGAQYIGVLLGILEGLEKKEDKGCQDE